MQKLFNPNNQENKQYNHWLESKEHQQWQSFKMSFRARSAKRVISR